MKSRYALLTTLGLAVSMSASAATLDFGSYLLDYDDTTAFGNPTGTGGSGPVSFAWSVPSAVNVVSFGPAASSTFLVPSYTISAKPGYVLSAVTGFLGNLVFNETGGNTTKVHWAGALALNGSPLFAFDEDLNKTITSAAPGFSAGYWSINPTAPIPPFASFGFSADLTLSASGTLGSSFASLIAQPQNQLKVSFVASPVPVPAGLWLLSSACAGLGFIRRRTV